MIRGLSREQEEALARGIGKLVWRARDMYERGEPGAETMLYGGAIIARELGLAVEDWRALTSAALAAYEKSVEAPRD